MQNLFILTGAGISAESGLGTFRDVDGLWTKYDLEDVASIGGYRRNPSLVLDFYNARRGNLAQAQPNLAHTALARLQQGVYVKGGRLTLVTQNVDDLHEKAGSTDVIHMHGELAKDQCDSCGAVFANAAPVTVTTACPVCGAVGHVRPHVVWFGEMPLRMEEIDDALATADLFVAIGTSGAVYPAAGYVALARRLRIPTLELNLDPADNADIFDNARYGLATEVAPRWVDEMLEAFAQGSRS
jgi:NAD-dependent deacetylase